MRLLYCYEAVTLLREVNTLLCEAVTLLGGAVILLRGAVSVVTALREGLLSSRLIKLFSVFCYETFSML